METRQIEPCNEKRKMRIRTTKHHLARLQDYPIGHHPNGKKYKLNTHPKTTMYSQTATLPHGLNTPIIKIYAQIFKFTRRHTTITQKRKHN